ncbi:flippase [Patescibacteria group bacterium]|nr:flippase [Patescibacteria group bacterium]
MKLNLIQRIAKNMAVLLTSRIVSRVLGFFYVMFTARYLGAQGFGVLSFALAFTGIFGIFANFGIGSLIVREVARDKPLAKKYVANSIGIKIILGLATFCLLGLTIYIMGYPQQTVIVVFIIAGSIMFSNFNNIFNSIFQAFEKMEYISLGQAFNSLLLLVGAVFAIRAGLSIVAFAVLYLIAGLLVLIYSFIVLRWQFADLVPITLADFVEVDWGFWKSTLKESLPFFLSAFVAIIAFRIDIIMLSIMKGDVDVGWYSAAYKLMEVFILIPATFIGAIYPLLSKYYLSSQESLKLAYQRAFKYLSILGLPIAVGATLLAGRIILLIFQSTFTPSIIALQILIWTIPMIFLTYMYGTILASINRQLLAFKINFSCMLLNIILNLILIPKYTYIGASAATVATTLLSLVLSFYFVSRFVCKIPAYEYITSPVIASVIMGVLVLFFLKMNLFLIISGSVVVYFGALFLLKTFTKEDYVLFRQIINLKSNVIV